MDSASVTDLPPVVMTRKEAMALGLKSYCTGKECPRGHISNRYTSNGKCISCHYEIRKSDNYHGVQCLADGCTKRREQKGYCPKHYAMWKKHGDPLTPPSRVKGAGVEWLENHKNYDGDDCLIWPFGSAGIRKDGSPGYGQAVVDGENIGAHVLMCKLAHGERPPDKPLAAHTCGKGHLGCVSPKHLKWATYAENTADCINHGTFARGETSPNAKLTVDDIRTIRNLKGRVPTRKVAEQFGIGSSQVKRIMNRETWKHID